VENTTETMLIFFLKLTTYGNYADNEFSEYGPVKL